MKSEMICKSCKHCQGCTHCMGYEPVEVPEYIPTTEIAKGVHISMGNAKLGKIPNFSLTPGVSCSRIACETCHVSGCYACDSYNVWPSVRKAWDENTCKALFELEELEEVLSGFFDGMNAPRYFRIHVGGDFITRDYAEMWYRIAVTHPHTNFLAFTKQFDIVRGIPFNELNNFTLMLSDWPGVEIPADLRELYNVAWLDDGTRPESTFPSDCVECPGKCDACGKCWNLKKDTRFKKHGSQAKKGKSKSKGKKKSKK